MEKNVSIKRNSIGVLLKKGWSILLVMLLIGLLSGYLISNFTFKKPYEELNLVTLNFKYKEDISFPMEDIISEENIERCKKITKSLETGKKVSTYSYVNVDTIEIKKVEDYYQINCNMEAFYVSMDSSYSDSAAKGFLKHLTLLPFLSEEEVLSYTNSDTMGHSVFLKFDKEFYEANSLDKDGKILVFYSNPDAKDLNQRAKLEYYLIWILSLGFGLFLGTFIFFIAIKNHITIKEKKYDNYEIYRTPFHKRWFLSSLEPFKNIKSLVIMASLLGFVMISKFLPIPSGFSGLGISFGYIFLSVGAMLYGPVAGLVMGALSDVIGYMIKPDGMFFIGYTVQAMLACFFYAICLYKTHLTFKRVFLARIFVNLICNVIIGSLSYGFMYGIWQDALMSYILTISLPKNLLYLLPQSLVLYFVLKALCYPMASLNLVDMDIALNASFF